MNANELLRYLANGRTSGFFFAVGVVALLAWLRVADGAVLTAIGGLYAIFGGADAVGKLADLVVAVRRDPAAAADVSVDNDGK